MKMSTNICRQQCRMQQAKAAQAIAIDQHIGEFVQQPVVDQFMAQFQRASTRSTDSVEERLR